MRNLKIIAEFRVSQSAAHCHGAFAAGNMWPSECANAAHQNCSNFVVKSLVTFSDPKENGTGIASSAIPSQLTVVDYIIPVG